MVNKKDRKNLTAGAQALFDYVTYQMQITIDGKTVYLNHFPFLCFAHGTPELYSNDNLAFNLFGHVHSGPNSTSEDNGRLNYLYPTQYDVGVDNNNYYPVSWQKVNEIVISQVENYKKINKI